MLITTNEAAEVLAAGGVRRESARRLLNAGFAGHGVRTRSAVLYDDAAVRALLDWPWLHPDELGSPCELGVLVVRAGEGVHLIEQHADPLVTASRPWRMSGLTRVLIRAGIDRNGFYPLAVTLSGFVARVGEVVSLGVGRRGCTELSVRGAGVWSDRLRGARLDVGTGGPWTLWKTLPRTTR